MEAQNVEPVLKTLEQTAKIKDEIEISNDPSKNQNHETVDCKPISVPHTPYYEDPNYPFYSSNMQPLPRYHNDGEGPIAYIMPNEPVNVARDRPVAVHGRRLNSYECGDAPIFRQGFSSKKIRNRFIQRVYLILSAQLMFTFLFLLMASLEPHTKLFFKNYSLVVLVFFMIIFVFVYCALLCLDNLRRTFPTNFLLLGLLTIALTMALSSLTAFYDTHAVLYSIGTTTLACLCLSLFAIKASCDLTGYGMILIMFTVSLVTFGFIVGILIVSGIYIKVLHVIFSAVATFLFGMYLVYDTQQIIGGFRYELSPEEYIYGALSLYTDVMYLFMHILGLIGLCE